MSCNHLYLYILKSYDFIMKQTNKYRIIHGRRIYLWEVEEIDKEIKPFAGGRSSHITLPRMHTGKIASVKILILEPFICKGCHETTYLQKDFSVDPNYCEACYQDEQKLKKLKKEKKLICGKCNKKISEETYRHHWHRLICEACEAKEIIEEEVKQGPIDKEDWIEA